MTTYGFKLKAKSNLKKIKRQVLELQDSIESLKESINQLNEIKIQHADTSPERLDIERLNAISAYLESIKNNRITPTSVCKKAQDIINGFDCTEKKTVQTSGAEAVEYILKVLNNATPQNRQ